MPDFDVKEKRFEQDIEEYLTTYGGYQKGNPAAFNREKALDIGTFLSFIRTSQPKQWERFEKIYGADSERQLIDRFCREVKMVGLLRVLRQGFTDRGIKFRAVFWKPETSINETSQSQYAANILHCTRQLHYSLNNENSIDIVLFLNGIPVVSMELKCQFTGQDTANAIQQYKFGEGRHFRVQKPGASPLCRRPYQCVYDYPIGRDENLFLAVQPGQQRSRKCWRQG